QPSSGGSPAGSTGTTRPGCTPRSGTNPRLSSNTITGKLQPRHPSRRSRNQPTLREIQDGSWCGAGQAGQRGAGTDPGWVAEFTDDGGGHDGADPGAGGQPGVMLGDPGGDVAFERV